MYTCTVQLYTVHRNVAHLSIRFAKWRTLDWEHSYTIPSLSESKPFSNRYGHVNFSRSLLEKFNVIQMQLLIACPHKAYTYKYKEREKNWDREQVK